MNILISKHANKRLHERKRCKSFKLQKDVENAWFKGIGEHNITEQGFEIIDKYPDKITRIYDNFIYLFVIEEDLIILVTLLYLDKEYRNKPLKKHIKKQSKGYINKKL